MTWAAFDIETTGLRIQEDRVIELALVSNAVSRSWLINPGVRVSKKITEITGITNVEIVANGVSFATAWGEFCREVEAFSQLVGHNVLRFDWPFLEAETRRHGLIMPDVEIKDTGAIFKGMMMREKPQQPHREWALRILNTPVTGLKYNLALAAEQMGVPVPAGLHRAEADATLTMELAKALARKLR